MSLFIDIKEPKNPLKIEVLLFPYKKQQKKITTEVCYEVLKGTNYSRSIRDMLSCILALPPEEQREFKQVVMSVFANRAQNDDVAKLGLELATNGNYKEEVLNDMQKIRPGKYLQSSHEIDAWNARYCPDWRDLNDCLAGKVIILDEDNVNLRNNDLRGVEKIKFMKNVNVDLSTASNLPDGLDFSQVNRVNLQWSDLRKVHVMKFKNKQQMEQSSLDLWNNCHLEICFAEPDGQSHWFDYYAREVHGR